MKHNKVILEMALDHLAGKPNQIEAIIAYRRCSVARAYQIVNEVLHMALGYVPTRRHRSYDRVRHPNLVGYAVRVFHDNGLDRYDDSTPEGFYRRELDDYRYDELKV